MTPTRHSAFAVVLLAACTSSNPAGSPNSDSSDTASPGPAEALDGAPTLRAHTISRANDDMAEHLGDSLAQANPEEREPDPRSDSPAWEAFYDPNAVHEVHIDLTPDAWDALEHEGRVWAPAAVTVDGLLFPNAGVRRKGSTTWQSMYGKPSFKVKLRAFGDGPRLVGQKRLTFNNMISDPSQAREAVALRIWRALGSEATHASWAQVWVNEEFYGLYSNIEPLDDVWLERRYRHPGGDLWEANDDADFEPDAFPYWELSEGVGDVALLQAVADAVADEGPGLVQRLAAVIDLDQFLRYWAVCLATGMTDGYPFHLNDAYIYADPGDAGRFDFLPWGMDEAWGDDYSPYSTGLLADACRHDTECEALRLAALADVITALESLDVDTWLSEAFAVSAPLTADDPRRPYSDLEVSAGRAELRTRVLGWPARIRGELGP